MQDYSNVVILTVNVMFCHLYVNRKGWLRLNLNHSIILNLVSDP